MPLSHRLLCLAVLCLAPLVVSAQDAPLSKPAPEPTTTGDPWAWKKGCAAGRRGGNLRIDPLKHLAGPEEASSNQDARICFPISYSHRLKNFRFLGTF